MSAVAVALEGGDLGLAEGVLAIVRPALDLVPAGGVVSLRSTNAALREDLPSWCRLERHSYLNREKGPDGVDVHLIERGPYSVPQGKVEWGVKLSPRESAGKTLLPAAEMLRAAPFPEHADPASGFAPRGARVEPGGPQYPWTLNDRARVAPPETAQIYDQAVSQQWDAARDIAWKNIKPLPEPLERAIGQIMTFLAENELSALYVPSRFLPRIHPAYAEVAMLLAAQLADEARHIDVFLKRARAAGGGLGISTATTSRSLHSLLEPEDFTEAAFLLSVLGEGTFLDLLRFIETHAPDEPTADLCRRARVDETRHVHFGMAHVRHALASDPSVFGRLEQAVARRAAHLSDLKSVPAPVQDALTVLAARGTASADLRRGHQAFAELVETMGKNRVTRLVSAGFSDEQAATLSGLHTANFM